MSVQDSVPLKNVILVFLAMLGQWPHMEGNHIAESEPQSFLEFTKVSKPSSFSSYAKESSQRIFKKKTWYLLNSL